MLAMCFECRKSNPTHLEGSTLHDQAGHRCSYLTYLLMPRAEARNGSSSAVEAKEKEHHSRISGAISSSIFSIGDLFKDISRDGPKSVKFPERLIKVLEQKLQDIARGKDASLRTLPPRNRNLDLPRLMQVF